jgi:hypothetical protein
MPKPNSSKGDQTMKRLWMSGAAAMMALSIAGVQAQQPPQSQPPQNPPATAQPPATPAQDAPATTVTGCVYKEADVPGRTPNIAEKAGVMEDYILVASAAVAGTAGTSGTTPPATAGTSGSMGSAPAKAYKLEKIADEQLKAVVGKRVEVTGRVDAGGSGATAKPDRNPASPDKIELPEFEVDSIKEVEGTCPATPNIRK